MNSLLRDYFPATYFQEYQVLRSELTDVLRAEDLAYQPAGGTRTLGELCRDIGEIEHAYIQSFRTFRLDFSWRHEDARVERDVAALTSWYADLDRDLLAAIEDLTEEDIATRRIARVDFGVDDFSPLPAQQLDIYREALLIFYAKVSIYLRALGRGLPGHWEPWIG
jgi:hypothetical protein